MRSMVNRTMSCQDLNKKLDRYCGFDTANVSPGTFLFLEPTTPFKNHCFVYVQSHRCAIKDLHH